MRGFQFSQHRDRDRHVLQSERTAGARRVEERAGAGRQLPQRFARLAAAPLTNIVDVAIRVGLREKNASLPGAGCSSGRGRCCLRLRRGALTLRAPGSGAGACDADGGAALLVERCSIVDTGPLM